MQLERISPREWKFIEPPCVHSSMDTFHKALEFFDSGDDDRAERMLREIIAECPEHIDALHHLALIVGDAGKKLESYLLEKEAVAIGFESFPIQFRIGESLLPWGWLENRPFLRAYHGLGLAYLERNEVSKAQESFLNLLSLNPNDNQGVRALSIDCFFKMKEPGHVIEICKKYPGDLMPEVLYGEPLALVQLGRHSEAKAVLTQSIELLPLVARELLKKTHRKPKGLHPSYVTQGGKDEAYYYWKSSGFFWENTEGALELLAGCLFDGTA